MSSRLFQHLDFLYGEFMWIPEEVAWSSIYQHIAMSIMTGWWFQPLWERWKSLGMIIPKYVKNRRHMKKCSKPPTSTNQITCQVAECLSSHLPICGFGCASFPALTPHLGTSWHINMDLNGVSNMWMFLFKIKYIKKYEDTSRYMEFYEFLLRYIETNSDIVWLNNQTLLSIFVAWYSNTVEDSIYRTPHKLHKILLEL